MITTLPPIPNTTVSASVNTNAYSTILPQPSNSNGINGSITWSGADKLLEIEESINKINERLAILVPDPVLLEKYEALRNAYEQYKTLERLCK